MKKSPVSPPAPTFSRSVTETKDGAHEFNIKGYSLAKGMGIGKFLTSGVFSVGGYDWTINFFPDGKSEEYKEYVSLFIALASEATDVRALFELKLMDQSGKGQHRIHTHFDRALGEEKEPHKLSRRGSMWGYKKFFPKSQLEGSDYLRDDCLQVHCRVGVVKTRIEKIMIDSVVVPPPDIGPDYGKLLESGMGADVSFVVDGEKFSAHKLVLAARSPVFNAQFFGPLKDETTDCINVEDMEASAFKALLHFVYWDALPDMYGSASTLMAQHLLAAADQYGLDRLRLMCEAKLCEEVAINNVATSLALAEQHRCSSLKATCLKFASLPENRRAVVQTDGYKYLKESCPAVLTELLEYVAGIEGGSVQTGCEMDGGDGDGDGDGDGRRVKQRRH